MPPTPARSARPWPRRGASARPLLVAAALVAAVVVVGAGAGCESFGGLGGSSGTATYSLNAKENYDKGMSALKAEAWVDAIRYFQFTKAKFGFSKWATLAELRMADANLGREKYQEAIDGYRTFMKNHPTHEMTQNGYASFKITETFYKQIPSDWFLVPPSYEKDQGPVRDALRELVGDERSPGFVAEYPDSPYVAQARKMAEECRRRLAEHELYVANFYLTRNKPQASIGRLERLLRDFPHSAIEPEVLLLLGRTYMKMDQPAQARATFERLRAAYPSDYHAAKAKLYLDHIARQQGARAAASAAPAVPDAAPPAPNPAPAQTGAP